MGAAERVRGIVVNWELGELGEVEVEARVEKGNRETRRHAPNRQIMCGSGLPVDPSHLLAFLRAWAKFQRSYTLRPDLVQISVIDCIFLRISS